ncbi:MAG: AAA family ATPase [Candidatus Accumulibacter sp.]|uniref:TrlF family AAA-like ATPase n=1 Tax=Accumulibacter sp. TaxID=2053492 RepID=UPI001A469702|nr:ATP-binding protein [Accumulibacter sp.]MBL8394563.1 AAA family ATPase [Accumulibacter sp.]
MAEYQGMRWLKCDFQVQTPEDNAHWLDDDLRLGNPRRPIVDGVPDESGIQNKARVFLRRCHALGLEIVGITDHNFSEKAEPRDWFLTHLVEQNASVAQDLDLPPLHILPGFEVDIGFHALCLFSPARKMRDLRRVSMILTKLGLADNQRFRNNRPEPLRYNDQTVSLKRLLEMVQREHGGIVIAAHADEKDGILHDARHIKDYQLSDLLAIEVTANPLQHKYLDILEGRNHDWARRGSQPAYVMSSDAKSLKVDQDGKPLANALGYRFTWVKMSKQSVEALRQAFLDPESRICLQPDRPSDRQTHPRIRGVRVTGLEFLADQELVLSENLNTVIGGRGSGKSTLLECLRFAFGREKDAGLLAPIRAKVDRIAGTFTQETEILVDWEGVPGQVDTIALQPRRGKHELIAGEAADFSTYLRHIPIQFFSQQQLTDLASPGKNSLLLMLDDACGPELQGLKAKEITSRTEIAQLFAAKDRLDAVRADIARLNQEIGELNRQWQARKDVQQEAVKQQRAQAARRYLDQVRNRMTEESARIRGLADDIVESHAPLGSEADNWPHPEWFKRFDARSEKLNANIHAALLRAADDFERSVHALFEGDRDWPQVSGDLDAAQARFADACRERGLNPQDVARMQEIDKQRQAKQAELAGQGRQEKLLGEQVGKLDAKLEGLFDLWRLQHKVRADLAATINRRVRNTIVVLVDYMGDISSFAAAWGSLAPDGRSRLGKYWADLGEKLFHAFRVQEEYVTPWEYIRAIARQIEACELDIAEYAEDMANHLQGNMKKWRDVRLTRVADLVDIELRRVEGGIVGRISDGKLSEGQRNTAVLNLLLAHGDGPIVIDQPEDELDSNFIYQDLVPLLRKVKSERQLIMATHNANLPVNGDADLIYALEATEGHGRVRTQGGLDRADVARAVLDIMEGSAEAFRRRREKYHF